MFLTFLCKLSEYQQRFLHSQRGRRFHLRKEVVDALTALTVLIDWHECRSVSILVEDISKNNKAL